MNDERQTDATVAERKVLALRVHETGLEALDVDSLGVSEDIRHWERVQLPRRLTRYRRWLLRILLVFGLAVLFIPWTQTVTVSGQRSAYIPYDRPQHIEARITGRIKKWHVYEGIRVQPGELLLELEDYDPSFMSPDLLLRLEQQKDALVAARGAALERAEQLGDRIDHMLRLVETAVPSAGAKVREAENRVLSGEQRLLAARIAADTAQLNVDRHRALAERGLVSQRELELAIQAAIAAQAELSGARAGLRQAEQAAKALSFDRAAIQADMLNRFRQARADRAAALAEAARLGEELAGTRLRLSNAEERRAASRIVAPVEGTVVRLAEVGPGETVQQGDILIQMAPSALDPAIEMTANSLDAPLLERGQPVRLLFYGTPPVQLASWPEEMAGTFWGLVKVVDQVSNPQGDFRLWVEPHPDTRPWPEQTHVRQGTPVMGWVITHRVPLIVELTRRIQLVLDQEVPGFQIIEKVVSKAGQKVVK